MDPTNPNAASNIPDIPVSKTINKSRKRKRVIKAKSSNKIPRSTSWNINKTAANVFDKAWTVSEELKVAPSRVTHRKGGGNTWGQFFKKMNYARQCCMLEVNRYWGGVPSFSTPNFLPEKVSNNDLTAAIGLGTGPSVAPVIRAVATAADPISLGLMSPEQFNPKASWLEERKIPLEILDKPKLLRFVIDSKIYQQANFYDTPIRYNSKSNDVEILVEGNYVSSTEFLDTFQLQERPPQEMFLIPPHIVHRRTGQMYQSFQDGLVPHNQMEDMCVFDQVEPSEPKVHFCFVIEGGTGSPGEIKRLRAHTWVRLENADGLVTSFGISCAGRAISPDPTEYVNKTIKVVSVPIADADFEEILKICQKYQRKELGTYNASASNCCDLPEEILGSLGIPVSSEVLMGDYDRFETRVKLSVLARELSKVFKSRTIESYAVVIQHILASTQGKSEGFRVDQAIQSRFVQNPIMNLIDSQGVKEMLLRAVGEVIPETVRKSFQDAVYQAFSASVEDVEESELQKLLSNITDHTEDELTAMFYSMFVGGMERHADFPIKNPVALFEGLTEESKHHG